MSTQQIRRMVGKQGRHAVVELNGVGHVYASVVPRTGGTLEEQARDVLQSLSAIMSAESASGTVIHQTVFLAGIESVAACRRIVRDFFGAEMPATSYVLQPPCEGQRLAIEAMGLGVGRDGVQIKRLSDRLVVVRNRGVAWVYADQVGPSTSAPGVYEKTICTYQHLRRLLQDAGAGLDQILRIWLCLGGIIESEGSTQRYKEMNRARGEVYQHFDFLQDQLPEEYDGTGFPASTGIGSEGRSITFSAQAVVCGHNEVLAVPLENPRQISAFDYAKKYSPTSPKFSRGLAVCRSEDTTLFISGTASITRSETQHPGDVILQTHETLDNIAALISEDNLSRHGLAGRGTTLEGLGVARVYVKRAEDHTKVREVCEQRLGVTPLTYVVADVCRPDLLVEIEGIAFSKAPPSSPPLPRRRRQAQPCGQANGKHDPYCPENCPERLQCPYAVLR